MERLQKVLAAAGVASRRRAEVLIREGRISVNGETATLGMSVDPQRDLIAFDGERVGRAAPVYWLLHKPAGVLTTARDPEGRRTVLDLVPERARIFPVGRLDRDTTGLLLLTNDGPLSHALLHPSHEIDREYAVTVRGRMSRAALRRLAAGVPLEEGRTAPARVERVRHDEEPPCTHFQLTLIEGRKRQIRRACAALGHRVVSLRRVRMGPLRLGRLPEGEARRLTERERRALQRLASTSRGGRPRAGPHATRGPAKASGKASKRPRKSKPTY